MDPEILQIFNELTDLILWVGQFQEQGPLHGFFYLLIDAQKEIFRILNGIRDLPRNYAYMCARDLLVVLIEELDSINFDTDSRVKLEEEPPVTIEKTVKELQDLHDTIQNLEKQLKQLKEKQNQCFGNLVNAHFLNLSQE